MRVLLAGKHAPGGRHPIGGVQSWIGTVAAELRRQGHHVTVADADRPVTAGRFDTGILANWNYTSRMASLCARLLVVSHGIIPDEKPPAGVRVASTSEGVRDHWQQPGPIVRQPIDLEFWSPAADSPTGRPVLLRYSYRAGMPWLADVARAMRMDFRHVRAATHDEARADIRRAACVVATGRAALEAMACGVPVVIADHRAAYQGPLLDTDTRGAMARNYSGRGGALAEPTSVGRAVFAAYGSGGVLRNHVESWHDVRAVARQLLELAG